MAENSSLEFEIKKNLTIRYYIIPFIRSYCKEESIFKESILEARDFKKNRQRK